jgi:hypothetical protein
MADDPVELEIPEGVEDAEQAVEVFRAWVADGSLHVVFDPDTFGANIGEWGRLLADASHHIARAVAMQGHLSEHEALSAIHEAYDRGLLEHKTTRQGRIKGGTTH